MYSSQEKGRSPEDSRKYDHRVYLLNTQERRLTELAEEGLSSCSWFFSRLTIPMGGETARNHILTSCSES
jgi:hypothetical protein